MVVESQRAQLLPEVEFQSFKIQIMNILNGAQN